MTRFYLYLNAALYLAFAAWCTLAPAQTAQGLGYAALSASGFSEYLVVYGGMELGFALFFVYCARRAQRVGLVFSVCLYAPIVAWRWPTVVAHWPVSSTTLATGALEIVLLAVAMALLRFSDPPDSH